MLRLLRSASLDRDQSVHPTTIRRLTLSLLPLLPACNSQNRDRLWLSASTRSRVCVRSFVDRSRCCPLILRAANALTTSCCRRQSTRQRESRHLKRPVVNF